MKKLLISCSLIGVLFAGETSVDMAGPIRTDGLNQGSQNLKNIDYISDAPIPGRVNNIKKSFYSAPPMIPHSVKGLVPITIKNNECLSCHTPKMAKMMKITAIPKSHFVDNFNGDKKVHKLAGSRFNCTQCHAPQAKLNPVIENKFESLR